MAARRKRHEEHEEHENHERWLITYADMITLLMVLFIVLFAIGQTDLAKFEALKKSLNNAFAGSGSGETVAITGGEGVLSGSEPLAPAISPDAALALEEKQARVEAVLKEKGVLTAVQDEIVSELRAHGLVDAARFKLDARGLTVTIVTDRVLFDLGSDALRPEGREVLDAMGGALAKLPNRITIEGHTDDRPISGGRFPSNWELSTARATSVLRYLVQAHAVSPAKLAASGYADQQPLAPNDTDPNRAGNRRVEILVQTTVDDHPEGA